MTSMSMLQLNCRPVSLNVKLRAVPFLLSLLPDDIWKSQHQLWERYSATQPFLISSRNALVGGSVALRHKGRLCSRLWEKRLGQKGIFINGQCVKNKVNWEHENLCNRNENLAHSLRSRRKQLGRTRERATRAPEIPLPLPPPILRPTTQAISLRAPKFQFSLITSIHSYLPPFPCGSLFS